MVQFIVRPVRMEDLDAVYALATQSSAGMSSLSKNKKLLRAKISRSLDSFNKNVRKPGCELYFFVAEDAATGAIVGTSMIKAQLGCDAPSFGFRLETITRRQEQGLKKMTMLLPDKVIKGPTEIGGLYLNSEYRQKGLGRLLSLSRFLFIALNPHRFRSEVIAEMRGVILEDGTSPFWDHVCRHFFDMDFKRADMLHSDNVSYFEKGLPTVPIYMDLLPEEAKRVIAQPHAQTVPAMKLLEQEGFSFTGVVDIFDAGPKVSCKAAAIRTVRECKTGSLSAFMSESEQEAPMIVSNGDSRNFRACLSAVRDNRHGDVAVTEECAKLLGLRSGDRIAYAPLFPANYVKEKETGTGSVAPAGPASHDSMKTPALSGSAKSGNQHFLRRFSEWYKAVANLLEVNG